MGRDGVQLFFALTQVFGQGLQGIGALLKIQGQHAGQAVGTGKVQGFGKVQAVRMGVGHHRAIDGAVQRRCGLAADPAAADETLKYLGHDELGCTNRTRTYSE